MELNDRKDLSHCENEDNNDENQEDVLSIDDIVKINENLEREAEALLGGQNDNVCTYPEGYKYRQPLYSCRTCAAENGGEYAGVCYACSGNCHEGHDLVELYTKRKFCCDCGNSKFKSKCKLFEEKCETNVLNRYNDNFAQIYCVCKKVHPPPSDEETADAGEMHQCCVCEDWFHLSHIYDEPALTEVSEKLQSEDEDENWELVCKSCVNKLPFLMFYEAKFLNTETVALEINDRAIAVEAVSSLNNGIDKLTENSSTNATKLDGRSTSSEVEKLIENSEAKNSGTLEPEDSASGSLSDGTNNSCSSAGFSNQGISDCKLVEFTDAYKKSLALHSIYFKPTWREQLCRCFKCLDMYNFEECSFLIDPEDTFAYYDAERRRNMALRGEEPLASSGGNTGEKRIGGGMENIIYNIVVQKTNNRDAALNAYMGVKQMYSHLGEFLGKRGEGKVITRRDIEQCFEELQAKRPRYSTHADDAAWTQGKVKKTQKCRNALRKLIKPTDSRINKESRVIRPKKEDEHALKTKEAPRISSAMFLKYNTQLGPPFHVIVDTNFVNLSIRNKIDMMKGFMDCLYAKVIPYIPDCVMGELEKMGRKFKLALKIIKDSRVQRLHCSHKGIYADDCIVQRVTQHKCYIVATCDRDLRMRLRKVPGVPIMYIRNHRYTIERMPDAYGAPKLG